MTDPATTTPTPEASTSTHGSVSSTSAWQPVEAKTFFNSSVSAASVQGITQSFSLSDVITESGDVSFLTIEATVSNALKAGQISINDDVPALSYGGADRSTGTMIVPVQDDGTFTVTTNTGGDLELAVVGYLPQDSGLQATEQHTVAQTQGRSDVSLHDRSYLDVNLQSALPDTPQAGVVLAVTVTNPGKPGYLTISSTSQRHAPGGTLSYVPGEATSATVVAPVGSDRTVRVFSSESADVQLAVIGQVAQCSSFTVTEPQRVVDTLNSDAFTRMAPGEAQSVQAVAFEQDEPLGGRTAAIVVTPIATSGEGTLTVAPTKDGEGEVMDIATGVQRSRLIFAPLNDDGEIFLTSTVPTDVTVDTLGFAGDAAEECVTVHHEAIEPSGLAPAIIRSTDEADDDEASPEGAESQDPEGAESHDPEGDYGSSSEPVTSADEFTADEAATDAAGDTESSTTGSTPAAGDEPEAPATTDQATASDDAPGDAESAPGTTPTSTSTPSATDAANNAEETAATPASADQDGEPTATAPEPTSDDVE